MWQDYFFYIYYSCHSVWVALIYKQIKKTDDFISRPIGLKSWSTTKVKSNNLNNILNILLREGQGAMVRAWLFDDVAACRADSIFKTYHAPLLSILGHCFDVVSLCKSLQTQMLHLIHVKMSGLPDKTEMAMRTIGSMRRNGCRTVWSPWNWNGTRMNRSSNHIVGFWLVEMSISTNQKPTIYPNLYENAAPGRKCKVGWQIFKHDIGL